MVFLHFKDSSGHLLAGVRVHVEGTTSGEFTSDGEGVVRLPSMRDGAYHLKFEKMGFTTKEQDLTLRGGQPDVIAVALSEASWPHTPTGRNTTRVRPPLP